MKPVFAGALAAASVIALSGCTTNSPVPSGPTAAEVQAMFDERNSVWWDDMFPGVPEPVVTPVEYLEPGSAHDRIQQCILDAQIDGVRAGADGSLSFASTDPATRDAFNLAHFTCTLRYPIDLSTPESAGYYSGAQMEYLDDYYRERLAPCLRMLGYDVPNPSARDDVQSSFGYLPYWVMTPQPTTEAEWTLIDLRCPPPPIGPTARGGF